jgi:hypothetical protein
MIAARLAGAGSSGAAAHRLALAMAQPSVGRMGETFGCTVVSITTRSSF